MLLMLKFSRIFFQSLISKENKLHLNMFDFQFKTF